jgi:hypothetical protein
MYFTLKYYEKIQIQSYLLQVFTKQPKYLTSAESAEL